MKSTFTATLPLKKYPYLGKGNNSGVIILFTSDRSGVVIANPRYPSELGKYNKDWCESNFKPVEGEVVIECP